MRHSTLNFTILTCLVLVGWSQAWPQTGPKIIPIDVSGATATEALFINAAGLIVGQYLDGNGAYHGFLRGQDGAITIVDAPGAGTGAGEGTQPWSINPAGEVTGWYTDDAGLTHGFVRISDGNFSTFDAPGASIPAGVPCSPPVICANGTQPGTINATGIVAGQYVDTGGVLHGFLRFPDGSITTFDAPGAATSSGQGTYLTFGDGINAEGAVLGGYADANYVFHGFLRSPDGTFSSFDPSGSLFTNPAGINAMGEIMGIYIDANGVDHGFLRSPEGEISPFDLNGAGTASGEGTEPLNINAPGDMVGTYVDGSGVNHGFLRTKNGTITTFDAPAAGTASGEGTIPFCNNPANAIVGFYVDSSGLYHGFLRE